MIYGEDVDMDIKNWDKKLNELFYEFQPIVNIRTGVTYGFEALLRNTKKIGFNSIGDFFDFAYEDSVLYKIDLKLREKAICEFKNKIKSNNVKLFYNVDNRVLDMPDYSSGNTIKILDKYQLSPNRVCFELTEHHKFDDFSKIEVILNSYKKQNYNVVIDDFGTGYSGLEVLYKSKPDIIKIDRLFIEGIDECFKKKLFVSNVVNLVHSLGIKVVAEGVETNKEFFASKEAGCDFVQGFYVQRPTSKMYDLKNVYDIVIKTNEKDKRKSNSDTVFIYKEMKKLKTINNKTSMEKVLDIFKENSQQFYFPVINELSEPIGIIRVEEIRKYVFSPFGKEVLINKMKDKTLEELIVPVPKSDINLNLEQLLKLFSVNQNSEGIVLTENDKYIGFLDVISLVNLMTEKNLVEAMDKNPLTKLPGNNKIADYITESLKNEKTYSIFVYFDFDNFKPFNDFYGFRKGDRAILMFSDLLKKKFSEKDYFIGHIGGDDFFLGIKTSAKTTLNKDKLINLIDEFEASARNLYNSRDLKRGYIESENRDKKKQNFPLLSISTAVLIVQDKENLISPDILSEYIFKVKKKSKQSEEKLVIMNSSDF